MIFGWILGVPVAATVAMIGIGWAPGAVPGVLVLGAVAALLAPSAVKRLAASGRGRLPAPLPLVAASAAVGVTVAGFVVAGLVVVIGGAAIALVATLGLGLLGALLVRRRRTRPLRSRSNGDGGTTLTSTRATPRPPHISLPRPTAALSTAELCRAWRRSYPLLTLVTDPELLDRLARLRGHYLDELERRDPGGFRRWLEAGARAASDPARFVGPGVALGPTAPDHPAATSQNPPEPLGSA